MGKIWKFLKGKKTYLGVVIAFIGKALKGGGEPELGTIVETAGEVIAGVGVADRVKDEALGTRDEK
jgi:hypothetical protein